MRKLSLFTIAALLFSCSDADDQSNSGPHLNYEPMAIGNEWIYEVAVEQPDGTFKINDRQDFVRVIGQELVNGIILYKYEAIRYEDGYLKTNYYRQDFDGYIEDQYGTRFYSPISDDGVLRSVPVITGDSSIAIFDYQMADEFDQVEVPAGTFTTRTVVADIRPGFFWDEDFDCGKTPYDSYARGVGLVKRDIHSPITCRSVISELLEYNLK